MRMPTIPTQSVTRDMIDTFRGYNHNPRIGANEFYNMDNMTSDAYPVLMPREMRGLFDKDQRIRGMIAKDAVCTVRGGAFYIGDTAYEMGLSDAEKTLISMGAYVIIMPDRKYINTAIPDDRGDIENQVVTQGDVQFQLSTIEGEVYEGATVSDTAPGSPKNGALWIDTSSSPHGLKKYSEATAAWVSIASTYVRISCAGIGAGFEKFDGVQISGIVSEKLKDLNGTLTIWDKGDDYLVLMGIIDEAVTQKAAEGSITIQRRMPEMDFICESENRLWGCRYGLNRHGETVNEIYACKLGDFKNWECYMGLSTDSYMASCGTTGPFTGAVAHMGYPLFYKEDCFHKVFGSIPANFQIQTTACRGVQKGSHKSMAVVNEVLYYKSGAAVCAYDGSLPAEISYCLGNERYSNAVGGGFGSKYYISMADLDGKQHLFVYDAAKKLWHREDDLKVSGFAAWQGKLLAWEKETGRVLQMTGGDGSGETDYHWSVETGEIGIEQPDMKYISRLLIRTRLEVGTEMRIFARYDFSEEWEPLFALRSTNLRSYDIPLRPKRCDYMKLRIEGDGPGMVYSITKSLLKGSGRS